MEINIAQEIELTRQELRATWAREWQEKYCRSHNLYLKSPQGRNSGYYDFSKAPVPPWRTYKEPELVGIRWETGFAVITAEAFRKLSQAQLSKLTGGKAHEKRHNVGRR